MRFPLLIFLFLLCHPVFSQQDTAVTLHDLRMQPYDSKNKFPAIDIHSYNDPFREIVGVTLYRGKKKFTGFIHDSYSNVIVGRAQDGIILEFSSMRSGLSVVHHYAVAPSGKYSWYASDTTFMNGKIFSLDLFYEDSSGIRMHQQTRYSQNDWVTIKSYRIGKSSGRNTMYHYPIEEGVWTTYQDGEIRSLETWRDGHYDGLMMIYDSNEVVLQTYYLNSWLGVHGSYYEYDTAAQIVVTGMYSAKHVETGPWIGKYTDSSIARISWFDKYGECDSTKSWDRQGNLINANYHYWRTGKRSGDFVYYSKTWYPNGELAAWENHSPFLNDTIHAQYTENGIPVEIECKYKGRIQKKTWYENGNPQTERYGVPSGIEGVTLRDSVFREWYPDGDLWKERYYDKGKFLRHNDPPSKLPGTYIRLSPNPAYVTIVNNAPDVRPAWDTSFYVPSEIVDSVSLMIQQVYGWCSVMKNPTVAAIDSLRDNYPLTDANGYPAFIYKLQLVKQEWVKTDSSGRITTANPALNTFLDSLRITGDWLFNFGRTDRKKGKELFNYQVNTHATAQYLNLFYINRRLAVLAPGSSMEVVLEKPKELPAEIIYIPQGEQTPEGINPVTIVAIAGNSLYYNMQYTNPPIEKYDARMFFVFYVYGDGEVEFVRTDPKDTLLLRYRGKKTGVYAPKRSR